MQVEHTHLDDVKIVTPPRHVDVRVLLSNCSNNYGLRQLPEKLIPLVIGKALTGQPIPVYGEGANVRDRLHVEDHANALSRVLTRGVVGRSYNIGGNAECSNLALIQTLCALLDDRHPQGAPHADLIRLVTDRPGHDFRYAIDASRMHDELGWAPSVALDQGISDTVDWDMSHPDWSAAAQHRAGGYVRLGAVA